jgi:hypothetical protein
MKNVPAYVYQIPLILRTVIWLLHPEMLRICLLLVFPVLCIIANRKLAHYVPIKHMTTLIFIIRLIISGITVFTLVIMRVFSHKEVK